MNSALPNSPKLSSAADFSHQAEALSRSVVAESLGVGILALDQTGKIVTWNVGAEQLFQYEKREIQGSYFGRLFCKEDQQGGMPERELQTAVENDFATEENWLMRKDGSLFWASGTTTALRNQNGAVMGYAKFVRDGTERKQLKAALSASEHKFQTTVAQIKDHAILSADPAGIITGWNESCHHLLGLSEKEALGTLVAWLFPPEGASSGTQIDPLQTAARDGASSIERFVLRKNRKAFWAAVLTTAVREPTKGLLGYTIVIRDLTERRRSDLAVRSSIERLQLLSDTARNLLVTDDPLALLDGIFDRLGASFGVDFYFHFAASPGREELRLRAYRGISDAVADRVGTQTFDSSVCGAVAGSREPRIISNVQASREVFTLPIREIGITAYACYPLVANQTTLGTLSFGTRREQAFPPEQLELFAALAHLFSEAIARRQVSSALRAREAQLTAVLEGAPSGLLILDAQGRVLMVNAQAEHLFGFPRADLLCRSIEQILPDREADGASVPFLRGLLDPSNGQPPGLQRYEIQARRKDGTEFPLEAWLSAAEGPEPGFVIVAFIDISERRKAESALRENERKLRLLNELGELTRALRDPAQIMAVVARTVGEHLQVSRCAYAKVELDGEHFTIPQDYVRGVPSCAGNYLLSAFGQRAEEAMLQGRTLIINDVDQELSSEAAAGFNAIAVKAIICCPLIKEGRLHAMMAVHQDRPRHWSAGEIDLLKIVVERCWSTIERAAIEQALRQNEERLKLAMDAGRLGMWQLDTDSGQATIDGRVCEFYGLPPQTEVVGIQMLVERIYPADREKFSTALTQASKGGAYCDVEFRVLRPDGSLRWVASKGDSVRDRRENGPTVIGVNYDLTAQKAAEAELREAQAALHRHAKDLESVVAERTAELRETVSELERFSYSLSHDMRAPLRAMQGFSEILEEEYGPRLDDAGRNYLKRITAAAGRLDQLIRDVLSYTHVVREDVRLKPIQVAPLLRQLIAENPILQPPLAEVVVEAPLLPVLGHEAYLTQCLSNLLSNGVKFVVPGKKPVVRIWTEARDGQVRLLVRDHGIGIPQEWQARIFGMFERMHPAGHYDGTGMGLTIVRKAAERMGGLAGVHSEPGLGSTFWIQLDRPSEA